jgi:MoxR-like ATPase
MNYTYYGSHATASEVIAFLKHLLKANEEAEQAGQTRTPACIWGRHGIGKTEIVQALAREMGYDFVYIAPAQFEEMGDLVGMPAISEQMTVFRAPDWVPTQEGPGILLLDDVNRADDRILRGIMQLLQNYELVSWKLPPRWHLVLTANPDGGDYSVTPMDDAMLTRMMHITLEFDLKEWARWAERNHIDTRGINFVLTYPETITGQRTTPRTLVQFFASIKQIEDLNASLPLVRMLADACLDGQTATAFINYVSQDLKALIEPKEICEAKSFENQIAKPLKQTVAKNTLRVDLLATIATRLSNYLLLPTTHIRDQHLENVKSFLQLNFLPNDIRLATARELVQSEKLMLQDLATDPQIGMLLLEEM